MKILVVLAAGLAALAVVGMASARQPSALPVIPCKTTYGVTPGRPLPPKVVATKVSASLRLIGYGAGPLVMLAPKGWKCNGLVAVDGGLSISIYNPRSGIFQVVGGYQPEQEVTAQIASAGTNGPLFMACPFFSDADYQLKQQGLQCSGEAMPFRERDSLAGLHLYTFQDPPGVSGNGNPSGGKNPANGFISWYSAADNHNLDAAMTATYTMPASKHALCTAILNDILARWARK